MDKGIIEQDLKIRKARLDKSTNEFKNSIMQRVEEIKADAKKWGTIAIIGLGTIYITYRVIKKAVSSDKPKQDKNENYPSQMYVRGESRIVSMIKEQIALFLFAIAKKKLLEYLAKSDLFDEKTLQ
jgi:hypothetical protein